MAREFGGGTAQNIRTHTAALNTLPLTYAIWVRPDAFEADNPLVSIFNDPTYNRSHRLGINASGAPTAISQDAGGLATATSATTLSTGAWAHIAAVFASTTSRSVYANGGGKATETTSRTVTEGNSTFVGGGTNFDGRIAEACIWAATLTDEEIAALATGISPRRIRPETIWGYWPLNGLDSPEPDRSGNMRNLDLFGSPTAADHVPISLMMRSRPPFIAPPVPTTYTQTKFRIYSNDGMGLGEAA